MLSGAMAGLRGRSRAWWPFCPLGRPCPSHSWDSVRNAVFGSGPEWTRGEPQRDA